MLQRVRRIIAVATLALSPVITLAMPGIAHAATITWIGGGTDGNWSTTANWAGGVAPTTGDSIVIDNAADFTNVSSDDIAGLSLASISFINNSSGSVGIALSQNLTVTGPITQQSSVTTTADAIGGGGSNVTLTLGANVVVSSTVGLTLGDPGDTLALGGNTLTFNETNATGGIVGIDADISGSGAIIYDAQHTDFQIRGNNTYGGTTHVMAASSNGVYKTSTGNANPFGTSAVTIEPAGHVGLNQYTTSTTLSNVFVVTGTTSGSPVVSMSFDAGSNSGVTLTVPNITLNGDTRFANDSSSSTPLTVNLAGITANGHCIEYIGFATGGAIDGPSNGFTNGPTGCVISAAINTPIPTSTVAPSTPDTGFSLVTAHPIVTLAITTASALVILAIARAGRKTTTARR